MVKRQKIEVMTVKYHKDKKRISLLNKKERNYEGDIRDNMNLDQANNKYSLQLKISVKEKLLATKKGKVGIANDKTILE